jgi:hypothetical protein
LFHPPKGGLVVGWRIVVVFYYCFTRLGAGSWLVGVLLLFFYFCFTRLGAGSWLVGVLLLFFYCCFTRLRAGLQAEDLIATYAIIVSPAYSGLTMSTEINSVFYHCFTT